MEIVKVEAIPITTPYGQPSRQGHVLRAEAQSVLVKLHTDEGIVGIGDTGACCRAYTGENQGGVMWAVNHFARSVLLGADPFNIDGIMTELDREAYWHNIAKGVIDNALHDLVGKALKVPVHKLLGGPVWKKMPRLGGGGRTSWPPLPKKEDRIKELVESSVKAVEEGAKEIFIKIGITFKTIEEEIETFKAIRDAVGDNIRIETDANAMWTPEFAIRVINKLDKVVELYLFEQPVHRLDVDGMAKVRRKVRPPIRADESAWSTVECMNLIRAEACDYIKIKINRAGGIIKARKCFAMAEAAGIPVICVTTIGNDVNDASCIQLAASNYWVKKSGFGGVTTVRLSGRDKFLTKEGVKMENRNIIVPNGPGLSFELDDKAVEKAITPGMRPLVIEKKYRLWDNVPFAYVMDEDSGIMR